MHVREAISDDVDEIAALHVRCWQVAYVGQLPGQFLASLSVERRILAWREIVASSDLPATGVFVLQEDRQVVGFAHVSPSRDDDAGPGTGEVTSIYVAPSVWRRGGGRLLMNAATQSLREADFDEATLWVLESNETARQFYEAVGWRANGVRRTDDRGTFSVVEVRYRVRLD